MDELISRQQALALEKELIVNERGYEKYNHGLNSYRTRLLSLPVIQPEIIRCKDCIHMQRDILFDDVWCGHVKGKISICENDYCSSAERKDDDKTQSDL